MAWEPTEEDVSSGHVVERGVVKYVCVSNDGGVSWWVIAGVLLDDCVIVVKCQGNPDAKRKQGSREPSDSTECINCGDPGGERWS